MPKPIIGISANQRLNRTLDDLPWTYAPAGFSEAVIKSGGIPLLLPIGDQEAAQTYVSKIDKLILIGGQNVDPKYYNEDKNAFDDDFFLERDEYEIELIKEAIKQRKPILGICRGMQLMNVFLGGSLHQNISGHWQETPSDTTCHDITIEETSFLNDIFGSQAAINSLHHQCIKDLAPDLSVITRDPRDETIEAVISNNSEIGFIGLQWHPELLQNARSQDAEIFNYFIQSYTL